MTSNLEQQIDLNYNERALTNLEERIRDLKESLDILHDERNAMIDKVMELRRTIDGHTS